MDEIKKSIDDCIDGLRDELTSLSTFIHDNPELGNQEYKAAAILCDTLEKYGFSVERGYLGIETAFKADYGRRDEVSVAIMAEYDALPGLGHGCGHNLICAAAVGAAIALKPVADMFGGLVTVFGTPAEETNGAKVPMAAAGVFDPYDIAIMAHPSDKYCVYSSSLAMDALQFEYFGKAAHAASAPHEGINALDAVLQLFNGVNALRQQMEDGSRVHGIITDGGKAPNIIPDHAEARFYVRAKTRMKLDILREKVIRCARGAEMATGSRLEISNFEFSFDDMVTNRHLAETCKENLKRLGVHELSENDESMGSTDMGNVSHRVPSMHLYFRIVEPGTPGHSIEMCNASGSEEGINAMMIAAKALAMTATDVMRDEELRKRIRDEFTKNLK
ncbi:M20 family metallopeptidase [Calorimonas adulescens]|uniref:Peptidase M20 domain-containing protein 2 n=1 Tax=Calorimonas adulescens TaxID=2606906 RepID=A0A5D8QH83_9THEO|nr:M20 family metallopeptidase [Calorimonas adulescens]TZE82923.1 M20 family metallopeptidase [Calorimonas adulescens]